MIYHIIQRINDGFKDTKSDLCYVCVLKQLKLFGLGNKQEVKCCRFIDLWLAQKV